MNKLRNEAKFVSFFLFFKKNYKNIVFYHIFIKIFKDLIKIFLKKMFCLKYQFQNINIFLFAFHY